MFSFHSFNFFLEKKIPVYNKRMQNQYYIRENEELKSQIFDQKIYYETQLDRLQIVLQSRDEEIERLNEVISWMKNKISKNSTYFSIYNDERRPTSTYTIPTS